jgi:ABC-type uncharacterized transport system substrate-binding protein
MNIFSRLYEWLICLFSTKKCAEQRVQGPRKGRIAVIVPHEKNLWAMGVAQRFISSLRERIGYQQTPDIEILCAQNDETYLVEKVLTPLYQRHFSGEQYEAIVTAGTWCSAAVRDAIDEWDHKIPQVFCSVQDPVGNGFVDSLEEPGVQVSGACLIELDYTILVKVLQAVCPDKKRILIPYSDYKKKGQDLGVRLKDLDRLIDAAAPSKLKIMPFPIQKGTPWRDVLRERMRDCDMVCTLPDNVFLSQTEQVIALCDEMKVPLCTAELTSVYHGASFGFGETGDTYGLYAAAIVYDMIVNGRDISTIPVIVLNSGGTFFFNRDAMHKQGVVLSEEAEGLLSMQSIFTQ